MLVGQRLGGCKQSIVLMTEPYTYENKITGLPGGTKLVYSRSKPGGARVRAGIAASLDVNITSMDSWCNEDCAVALARIGGEQTVLVSLYMDITKQVQPRWLDDLMRMIEEKRYPVIMGIDSNAHSTMYGPTNNVRGSQFEDFVLQYGLKIENLGDTPTFETRRGSRIIRTHIDVTLSRDTKVEIRNWRVNSEYNASDHNTIEFEMNTVKPEPELIRPWSKADWGTFGSILADAEYNIPEMMSMKKLDKLVDRSYLLLEKALDKACPKTKLTPTVKKSHWATEKHEKGKARVSDLYRAAKKSGAQTDWDSYRTADKEFKRVCKNDKNRAWRKYKESIQSEQEMAKLAKAARGRSAGT